MNQKKFSYLVTKDGLPLSRHILSIDNDYSILFFFNLKGKDFSGVEPKPRLKEESSPRPVSIGSLDVFSGC